MNINERHSSTTLSETIGCQKSLENSKPIKLNKLLSGCDVLDGARCIVYECSVAYFAVINPCSGLIGLAVLTPGERKNSSTNPCHSSIKDRRRLVVSPTAALLR